MPFIRMTRKRRSKYPDAAGEGRRLKMAPFASRFSLALISHWQKRLTNVLLRCVFRVGLEPTTIEVNVRCSTNLSYLYLRKDSNLRQRVLRRCSIRLSYLNSIKMGIEPMTDEYQFAALPTELLNRLFD